MYLMSFQNWHYWSSSSSPPPTCSPPGGKYREENKDIVVSDDLLQLSHYHHHHHHHQDNVHNLRVWWINDSHWNYSSPPLPNLREASHPPFSTDLFSGFLPHSSLDLSHISLYPPQVCQSLVPQPLSRIFSATPALPLACGGQDWTKKCVLCYHRVQEKSCHSTKQTKTFKRLFDA